MARIHIHSLMTSWTGYGQIAEWLCRGLDARGHGVTFSAISRDDRHFPPAEFVQSRLAEPDGLVILLAAPEVCAPPSIRSRPYVHFAMWETDRIGGAAAANLSRAALVVTPCRQNAGAFRASGVTAPIAVVPLGVSADEGYCDDGSAFPDVCRFGLAARLAHGRIRKGLREGLEVWHATFPPEIRDVRLAIKIWPDDLDQLAVPDDPRIEVITEPYRPPQMAAWYRSLTALLVPSKGEGWGLHTHQAMACGRPVIAAGWGGTADLVTPATGWLLPFTLRRAREFYRSDDPANVWAVPTPAAMNEALLAVYADETEAQLRGRAAAARAAEFTWVRTAAELEQAIACAGLLEAATGQAR
jgi:glycosyltransferase involved in cell wall biosynthesis